jgi:hypothetical protein
MCELLRQLAGDLWLNLVEGSSHLVLLRLLLLNLADGRDGPLRYLVRMFQIILQFLIGTRPSIIAYLASISTQVVRLLFANIQLGCLLGRWRLPAIQRQFSVRSVHFSHERRWQRRLTLSGARNGRIVRLG